MAYSAILCYEPLKTKPMPCIMSSYFPVDNIESVFHVLCIYFSIIIRSVYYCVLFCAFRFSCRYFLSLVFLLFYLFHFYLFIIIKFLKVFLLFHKYFYLWHHIFLAFLFSLQRILLLSNPVFFSFWSYFD